MANPETIYRGPYEIRIRRVKPKGINISWGKPLNDPLTAAQVGYSLTKEDDSEVMYVVGLDGGDRIMFVQELYRGTNLSVITRPSEIFRAAVIDNASKIIVYHNHVTNDPMPSADDKRLLTAVVESGKILGIGVSDFQIVCDDPNLFWSASIAVGGKLMTEYLADLDAKFGMVDIIKVKEVLDARNLQR
jgi:DNA repair protein RadC